MSKNKNEIVPLIGNLVNSISGERTGVFKQGRDKLNRPYEKKLDTEGFYTKQEILKDGTPKYTIKDLRHKKKYFFRRRSYNGNM